MGAPITGARAIASGKALNLYPATQGGDPNAWLHDERESKRQKRKQSHRESARRSRLRKQAECEELGGKVSSLEAENGQLRGVRRESPRLPLDFQPL